MIAARSNSATWRHGHELGVRYAPEGDAGKTAAEQQAPMQEQAKSMPPETRQRMQEMQAQCK